MPLKSDCLKMYDFASVTPLGIRYQQLYYTCSKAIRERWFEISQRDGDGISAFNIPQLT